MKRVLHVGNIANNAYNNVKYLYLDSERGYEFEHLVLSYDNPHCMAQPEWEEVETDQVVPEFFANWSKIDSNFVRPTWFNEVYVDFLDVNTDAGHLSKLKKLYVFKSQKLYRLKALGIEKDLAKSTRPDNPHQVIQIGINGIQYLVGNLFYRTYLRLLPKKKLDLKTPHINSLVQKNPELKTEIYSYLSKYAVIKPYFDSSDIIQGYGTDVILAWLFSDGKPYIAYEHGTLRDLPFANNSRGKLLSLAYVNASHVFITNADTLQSAKKLGLNKYSFVPHILDPNRYKPSPQKDTSGDFTIFSPTRHNWRLKGNDKIIEAFAEFVAGSPNAILKLVEWGQNAHKSRELVNKLNIGDNVEFITPHPKRSLLELYQACDVVIDQLVLPTFGGISPEGMSSGKPVITYYDPKIHEWCFENNHPPILSANDAQAIVSLLVFLKNNPDDAIEIGEKSRKWIFENYCTNLTTKRLNQTYRYIMSTYL